MMKGRINVRDFLIKLVTAVSSRKGRWITLATWIVLVAILSIVFPMVNAKTNDGAANLPNDKMSVQAAKIAKEQFPNNTGTPLLIVWHRESGLNNEDFQTVSTLYKKLNKDPLSQQSFIPPLGDIPSQSLSSSVSEDGTSLVTPIFMNEGASTDELDQNLKTLKKEMMKLESKSIFKDSLKTSGLHVRFTGPVAIGTDATDLFSQADVTLLIATVLLVLILLIILYRSPILAIIPLIGVGFAYGATSPILGFLADKGYITIDSQAVSIMTVLLFGAGTDYCLFLVSKYREVLFDEEDPFTALKMAIKHSGGAIFVSAITVVVSLCTLLLAQYGSFHRFAVPFSLVIFIMGLTALTLLPALLAIFGRKAFFPFIPRTEALISELEKKKGKKIRRLKMHSRFNTKLGKWVTKKPWTVIVISLIVLGVLASFSSQLKYTQNLLDSFPKDMPSREGYELMADHLSPGELAPVQLIVNSEGKKLDIEEQLADLSFIDQVSEPTKGINNENYLSYTIDLKKNPYDEESVQSIPLLTNKVENILKAEGIKPNNHYWVGGETSSLYDTEMTTDRDFKMIIPVVIVIIAALLLTYLRSIIAMVYLMLTVLLSYLSAMGAGWILIHYGLDIPAISGLIPLYSFVFLVALGEDYNIFMVSSIWKNKKRMPHREAIAKGVSETSSVITSAGLILAGTFAVLALLPIQVLLQFGIITAIGVLLDTFIVRPLLVPAITTVLGRFAYWPGRLWKEKEKNYDIEKHEVKSLD